MILETGGAPTLDAWHGLATWPEVQALRTTEDGLHCVLGDHDGPHHVWLRACATDREQVFVIPRDKASNLRHRASLRLDSRLAGRAGPRGCAPLSPTHFQRQRLNLLIGILDALETSGGAVTMHGVASSVVYPRQILPRGSAWKGSNERRRTRRLVDEALALRDGGYRDLFWMGTGESGDPAAMRGGGGTKGGSA